MSKVAKIITLRIILDMYWPPVAVHMLACFDNPKLRAVILGDPTGLGKTKEIVGFLPEKSIFCESRPQYPVFQYPIQSVRRR